MNPPVKKDKQDQYFVSMEYHLAELEKYEQEIKDQKKYIRYLKDENKELEEKKKEAEDNLKKVLKLFKDTNYEWR